MQVVMPVLMGSIWSWAWERGDKGGREAVKEGGNGAKCDLDHILWREAG